MSLLGLHSIMLFNIQGGTKSKPLSRIIIK